MYAMAKFALLGAISGALYGLWTFGVLESLPGSEKPVLDWLETISNQGGAGLIYGVIVGALLRRPLGFSTITWLLFIIAGGACYYAAVNIAILFYDRESNVMTAIGGGAAGLVGAFLFSAATAGLSSAARHGRFLAATTITGAVLGLLLPLGLNIDSVSMWIAFFALWQAGYAGATAYATRIA